jgi:hypothetical protein
VAAQELRGERLPGQRSETVRRANLSAILRELHNAGPLSRTDLVARTGLTRSAIRALIGELVVSGLVTERRPPPQGTPGRPSPLVHAGPESGIVLALEIKVDSVAVAAVGLGGEVLDLVRLDRPRERNSVSETVADLAALVRQICDRRGRRNGLMGIGVAVVGRCWRWRWGRASRSRSPTRRTWARWRSCAAARPSAPTTCCSSRARSASAAG